MAAETHLLWRAQVYTQLRSNLLHGYVEGTFPCPASTVSSTKDGATETSPNPLFAAWVQQDQAILSALLSTSTPAVGAMIMFATTSAEAWTIIERTFAAQTSARSSQIRAQLAKMEKLDTSIAVYYNKIKTLSDTLTSIGQPLRPEEFSNFVLDGLDEDYDSVVEAVRNRDDPMPAHDLYSRLLSTEQRIDNRRPSAMSLHSANAAKFNGKLYRPPPRRLHQPIALDRQLLLLAISPSLLLLLVVVHLVAVRTVALMVALVAVVLPPCASYVILLVTLLLAVSSVFRSPIWACTTTVASLTVS
jgi:hypothetical protein